MAGLRAFGSRRKVLKWVGVPLAGLLTLILLLALVTGLIRFYQLSFPANHPAANKVATGAEHIARGKYLAQVLCAGCHSMNNGLPLSGGKNLADDIGLPLGNL